MKILLKFNENTKLFLASYFYRFTENEITEDMITPILECMLRLFTVLELVNYGYSSRYFKTFLFAEEVKLADKNISIEEIKIDFDEHIRANWTSDTIKSAIQDYD